MTSEILCDISPFKYLSRSERISLFETMNVRDYSDGETIIDQGQRGNEVFLLVEGQVSIIDPSRHQDAFVGRIGAGNYFGERSALFGDERRFQVVAFGACKCYVMPGDGFLSIIKESMPVAHALARNLRQKQNLFAKLDSFHSSLEEAKSLGVVDLSAIIKGYKALSPALHPGVNRPEIDTGAWLYAARRLPENLTKNYVMLLSRNLPLLFSKPDEIAEKVVTKARRRSIWELKTGKSLVLLRDGQTDFIDFMTNLCLHSVEARKLRKRIQSPHLMGEIAQALKEGGQAAESMLERLPVSSDELEGLKEIWPKDLLTRIYDMLIHHEDFSIFVDKALGNDYNADGAELWTQQIRERACQLMGNLEDLEVDIISSNTHSVINCLSPFLHRHSDAIDDWAKHSAKDLKNAQFHNESDRLYALSYRYLKAHPEVMEEMTKVELEHGISTLPETEFTGLQVDLIDLSKLDYDYLDPILEDCHAPKKRRLLVNIDYAFGCQAEDILGCLILLFGQSIRSINILGKAGALCGERGDILLPCYVLNQAGDNIFPVGNEDMDEKKIAELSGVDVHAGPVLTVAGTLLQNKVLLNYYRKLWRCVGLEMEGSFYAKQIERSQLLGLVRDDLKTRFLYYVSDLPLNENHNLSMSLAPWEGIPPLYATTRAVLNQILSCDR